MTDYTDLVKALRYECRTIVRNEKKCKRCVYRLANGACDDFLLAHAAAAAIEELQQIADNYEQTAKDYWKEACEYKAQLPKRGEWKRVEDGESYHYECSQCGERPLYSVYGDIVLSGTCPNCGAKMDGKEKE